MFQNTLESFFRSDVNIVSDPGHALCHLVFLQQAIELDTYVRESTVRMAKRIVVVSADLIFF